LNDQELKTLTMPGLHEYVVNEVLPRFVKPGERAIDLGAGSGALAVRMQKFGWDVTAADMSADGFKSPLLTRVAARRKMHQGVLYIQRQSSILRHNTGIVHRSSH
jgi:2-polyprenyl-3-methyl-5-hydroxy-6-metoxy-1,4-benzoquinol methylase